MSTRFYYGQPDYIDQLNLMDDALTAAILPDVTNVAGVSITLGVATSVTGNLTVSGRNKAAYFTTTGASFDSDLANDATGTYLAVPSTKDFRVYSGGGQVFQVQSNGVTTAASNLNAGTGSGGIAVYANGGNSGAGAGGAMIALNAGSPVVGLGNRSVLIGGAFDATPMLFSVNPVVTNFRFEPTVASDSTQLRLRRTTTNAGFADLGADSEGLKFWPDGYGTSSVAPKMVLAPSGRLIVGESLADNGVDRVQVLGSVSAMNGGVYSTNGTIVTSISYSSRGEIGTLSNHNLGFHTNGTTQMLLDTSGNLGVGSTAPISYSGYVGVTVKGSTGGFTNWTNGDQTKALEAAMTASEGYLKTVSSHPLIFGTANSERARLTTQGDFLLGTTSRAHLAAFSGSSIGQVIESGLPTIALADTDNADFVTWIANSSGIGYLMNKSAYPLVFGVASAEKVRISTDGALLINTTSDDGLRKFQVAGNGRFANNGTSAYNPNAYMGDLSRLYLSGGGAANAFTGIQFSQGGNFEAMFGAVQNAAGAADFVMQGYDGTGYREYLRLSATYGSIGLSIEPKAWGHNFKGLDMTCGSVTSTTNGNTFTNLVHGTYFNGTNWIHRYTDVGVGLYEIEGLTGSGAVHRFYTGASSTVGSTVSLSQKMSITSSSVNVTNVPFNISTGTYYGNFNSSVAGNAYLQLDYQGTSYGYIGQASGTTTGADTDFGIRAQNNLNFGAGGAGVDMTLTSAGNLILGNASSDGSKLRVYADTQHAMTIGTAHAQGGYVSVRLGASDAIIGYFGSAYQLVSGAAVADFAVRAEGALVFAAGTSNERARITSDGNLLVGTTSTGPVNANAITIEPANSRIRVAHASTSNGTPYIQFDYNGTEIGSITQSTTSAVAYNTSSDYRLKEITGPITTSGAYIDSLNPVEGTWKSDGSVFVGLIAHETQEASRTQVATGVKDGPTMQAMDYSSSEIIANMIAELKSLRARVAQLESDIL